MRTAIALTLFLLLPPITCQASAQVSRGTVKQGLAIESKILGKPVRYTIYLPFDYETSTRFYPVVYMLHGGLPGSDVEWIDSGEANLTADEAISNRSIPPMILVMPDAGMSRYINNYDNSVRYEDFFFKEFIPSIWDRSRGFAFGQGLKGNARITDHYKSYDPLRIAQSADPEKLKTVRLYLDCGDDDFRNDANATFHILLRRLKIPHEYRVRDGDHTWSYWRSGLSEGLKFIGNVFRGL